MRYVAVVAVGLAVAGAVAVDTVSAGGKPQLTASVSRTVLHSAGKHSFTLRLRIVNSGSAQRLAINVAGARWPGGQTAGGTLRFGRASMHGAGSVTVLPFSVPPIVPGTCIRGPIFDVDGLLVSVPAQTTTTLRLPLTAVVPPWPGTHYTPAVTVFYADGQRARLPVPHVTMRGPTGVHITVSVRHRGASIRAGAPATIVGTTVPAVRGADVSVTFKHVGALMSSRTAVGRTDGRGRFRVRWKPALAGGYQVSARIRHPGRGLLPDSACPVLVDVLPKR
jgi:hypothetical protein